MQLYQFLVANLAEPTATAALPVLVGSGYLAAVVVDPHFRQQIKQGILQILRVIHGKVTGGVVDDTIRRSFTILFLNQETVERHLKYMAVIRRYGCSPGLDLHRDDFIGILDKVIWLSSQTKVFIKERQLKLAPGARVGVDNPPAGQAAGAALAS